MSDQASVTALPIAGDSPNLDLMGAGDASFGRSAGYSFVRVIFDFQTCYSGSQH